MLSISNATVSESAGSAGFTVSLSPASSQTVTVMYASANGTATAPDDYSTVGGTLTFTSGQTSKPVRVTVVDDALPDSGETFTVTLDSPVGATLGAAATGTATITDTAPSPCGDACFGLNMPVGATVLLGTARTSMSVPYDLTTLGACQP